MDEDFKGSLVLELIINTQNIDFITTYRCLTVCKHVYGYAHRYLEQLLNLRLKYTKQFAIAAYKKLLRQPVTYTDVISIPFTPQQDRQEITYNLYNKPFTEEFLNSHILAISGVTLWAAMWQDSVVSYTIDIAQFKVYKNRAKPTGKVPGTDLNFIKFKYPNRHNPIPLIKDCNGYESVSITVFEQRQQLWMDIMMFGTNALDVKKIIVEYVYAPKPADINYAVVFDGSVNSFIYRKSFLVVDSPHNEYITPPPAPTANPLLNALNALNALNVPDVPDE